MSNGERERERERERDCTRYWTSRQRSNSTAKVANTETGGKLLNTEQIDKDHGQEAVEGAYR